MRCSRCGAINEVHTKFCPECGSKFVARPDAVAVEGDPGALYCFRHKKEITRVTCGKCEKPLCPNCMVMSSAGIRCKECARHNVSFRWRGLAHGARSSVGKIDGRKIWYLYILSMIARFFGGWFR